MGTSLLANPAVSNRASTGFGHRVARVAETLTSPWRAWLQRRRAAATAREVLRLDRMLTDAKPWLTREQRHRELVAAYLLCDAADACALLRCAEASFASWPVRRDLTLRDVAHYIAVSELLADSGETGVHASLKPVIDATIPAGL